jgi:hypothetical protein
MVDVHVSLLGPLEHFGLAVGRWDDDVLKNDNVALDF